MLNVVKHDGLATFSTLSQDQKLDRNVALAVESAEKNSAATVASIRTTAFLPDRVTSQPVHHYLAVRDESMDGLSV